LPLALLRFLDAMILWLSRRVGWAGRRILGFFFSLSENSLVLSFYHILEEFASQLAHFDGEQRHFLGPIYVPDL